jgi:hypothetical protein
MLTPVTYTSALKAERVAAQINLQQTYDVEPWVYRVERIAESDWYRVAVYDEDGQLLGAL